MRLKERYQKEIVPTLLEEFKLKNRLSVPQITKVMINVGLKEAREDKSVLEKVSQQLGQIAGQKPVITKARQSIAGFSLRAGQPIGLKLTLRQKRMYDFLEKLFRIVLAQVKDFQGLNPQSFDGHGNYTLGLEEQVIFPEIDYDQIDKVRGLEITIVTNTHDDKKAQRLLELMGAPFRKSKIKNQKSKTQT